MFNPIKAIRAEIAERQEVERQLHDALIDDSFFDRIEFSKSRPIEREPHRIPVRGDEEPQSIFVRIINPRSIDGVFAR